MKFQIKKYALIATMFCCVNLGCTGLTLGPQVRTEYTILHAGRPIQILENSSVTGRVLDGSGDAVEQDVGGWIAMPFDHWTAIKNRLELDAKK